MPIGIFSDIAHPDFGHPGFPIVGLFMVAWIVSVSIGRFGRLEQRLGPAPGVNGHDHEHD